MPNSRFSTAKLKINIENFKNNYKLDYLIIQLMQKKTHRQMIHIGDSYTKLKYNANNEDSKMQA